MINDISGVNDKIMNEMYTQTIQARKTLDKLNQSQAKDYTATEDLRQLRASNRKNEASATQSFSSEGQSSLEGAIQEMRSLSNKAAAEGAAQASARGESIADSLSKRLNTGMGSTQVSSGGDTVSMANIQSTGSENTTDVNMGNEISDYSRFNAIAQQGVAMLSRSDTVSGQVSNASTEATKAASKSQVSEAGSDMASKAASVLESAVSRFQTTRANLGEAQNRLEQAITKLSADNSDTANAEQRIREIDMQNETMRLAKYTILNQAGTAMLSQANQTPQQVLQLLGG